jgi:hypothetical protein
MSAAENKQTWTQVEQLFTKKGFLISSTPLIIDKMLSHIMGNIDLSLIETTADLVFRLRTCSWVQQCLDANTLCLILLFLASEE